VYMRVWISSYAACMCQKYISVGVCMRKREKESVCVCMYVCGSACRDVVGEKKRNNMSFQVSMYLSTKTFPSFSQQNPLTFPNIAH
jgi:hypothetical protein